MNRFYRYENRIRFYILVIALCGLSALFMELTAQQSDRLQTYARQQLEDTAYDTVKAEVQKLVKTSE